MWEFDYKNEIKENCRGMTPLQVFSYFKLIISTRFPGSYLAETLQGITLTYNKWRYLEDTIRCLSFAFEVGENLELYRYANVFISVIFELHSPHDQQRKRAREHTPDNSHAGSTISMCSLCWRYVIRRKGGHRRMPLCPKHTSTSNEYKRAKRATQLPARSKISHSRIDELIGEERVRAEGVLGGYLPNRFLLNRFMDNKEPFAPSKIRVVQIDNYKPLRDIFPRVANMVESTDGDMADPLSIITILEGEQSDEPEPLAMKRRLLYECLLRDFSLYRFNLIRAEAWLRMWEERQWGGKRKNAGRPASKAAK